MATELQPVLFVSHGAPTLALDGGAWGAALQSWGSSLREVRGILVLSAHWEQGGPVRLTAASSPATLYDFGGFPEELYRIQYPAPGDPALATRAADLLRAAGEPAELDPSRPLDHGAWVPLRAAFPGAQVPVVQVSLPVPRTLTRVCNLGRALAPLRREGILLAGSGGVVHNLRQLDWSDSGAPADWARDFEGWIADRIISGQTADLLASAPQAPGYARAVPTSEHFDPLAFALGAAGSDPARPLFDGWQLGSLSLKTWIWG